MTRCPTVSTTGEDESKTIGGIVGGVVLFVLVAIVMVFAGRKLYKKIKRGRYVTCIL